MATFLIIHGAWSAGWAWRKLRPLLRTMGHEVFTPTCTGLGERAHLAHQNVNLDTHIEDILAVLEYEDLHDVVLIGHSYGGMVATGVADRAATRLSQLVYLDAYVPSSGQSLFDLIPPAARDRRQAQASDDGQRWLVAPNPLPPDTDPADIDWALPRRRMQPIGTFNTPVQLTGAVDALPRSYIYCTRSGPGDLFRPFAERAHADAAWRYFELDASHNPHITMPATLAELLHRIAATPTAPNCL